MAAQNKKTLASSRLTVFRAAFSGKRPLSRKSLLLVLAPVALIIAVFAIYLVVAKQQGSEQVKIIALSRQKFGEGDFVSPIADLERLHKNYPDNQNVINTLIDFYSQRALNITTTGNDTLILVNMATLAAELESKNATDPRSFQLRGALSFAKHNFGEAAKNYEKAYNLNKEQNFSKGLFTELAHRAGHAYFFSLNLEKAEEYYELALSHSPDNLGAKINLAIMRMSQGKFSDAIKLLDEVLTADPSRHVRFYALLNRATAQSALGNRKGAEEDVVESYSLEPQNPLVLVYMGEIAADRKNLDEAVRFFNLALYYNPDLAKAHYDLAKVYRDKGDVAQAKVKIQEAIQALPRDLSLNPIKKKFLTEQFSSFAKKIGA